VLGNVLHRSLEDLKLKYLEILSIRLSEKCEAKREIEMRARMARLASRFPGALRELDDLELEELERRCAALDAVLQHVLPVEPWMDAIVQFHALARGALCAKRWLQGRRSVAADSAGAFVAEIDALPYPDDARAWAFDLARIASPPGGRVTNAVFERLAKSLGTTEVRAKFLVFGTRRRPKR